MTSINLDQYITDRKLDIDQQAFRELSSKYEKKELISAIADLFLERKLDFPFPLSLTPETVESDFVELSKPTDLKIFTESKQLFKFEYQYPAGRYLISNGFRNGNNLSNYFQYYNRMTCETPVGAPIVEFFRNRSYLTGSVLPMIWCLKYDYINSDSIIRGLNMGRQIAGQFKPVIAKALYEITDSKKVLDLCAGWGDRLAGFYVSSAEEYFGIDPNTKVFETYYTQEKFYRNLQEKYRFPKKKCTFVNKPAEDTDIPENYFDIMFTSPPYFDVEVYSKDETQSCIRYQELDSWIENFLFKSLEKAFRALNTDGRLLVNISDFKKRKSGEVIRICDRMNDFIRSLGMGNFECIGMKLNKRYVAKNDLGKLINDNLEIPFVEPVWCWCKNPDSPKISEILDSRKGKLDEW